ncbi:MAG: hypothetical protein HGA53_09860, partial [Anaerolineaceae bacterium]|nr:hypothetical protein [Anaerolineaceae bacterium]
MAGEQSTLSLETSFGLRARLMRLYFLYKDVGKPTLGPEKRFSNTQFLEILPNYIKTLSRPFTDIEVTSEYFAQASDAIAGRITLNNTGSTTKYIQTDAFCKLIPFGQGKQAGVQQQGLNKVFAGHCGDIYPCFFITGGPEHNFGQSSSLRLSADLAPKGSTTYNWSMVSSTSLEESFTRAKQLISLDWEGTSAYLDLL